MAIAEIPEGWVPYGESGRFYAIELPMSAEAIRLNGGPRHVFYGEFDTILESEAWREYLYDPLRMLIAEDVPLPPLEGNSHLGINILKLEEIGGGELPDDYETEVRERGSKTLQVLKDHDPVDPGQRERHVSTLVINHEIPLNPRIGTTY